ncbi:hypothetical protein [Taibaiella soli]|uniref:Gliding motility-associated protein GldM N-terminal domain-containing protein n=1 Tax=Taibaiella soli TaxID=1649169 RepID=A0A2W2AUK9_9BACT|nr:hypothetical protein [Taibaiella soli]PZF71368.1 hypothetical protein DN068_18940 [Taibaiella soli]
MYFLSDQQIDYILDDISARGVKMEGLQQDLLDHVCCIIEQNLEANGDFEQFYQTAIQKFYKTELSEIERETILLLTFKNYYAMRKTMFITGAISAVAFILGSVLKIMHSPGAGLLLLLGFITISFLFLPLLFIIKSRETTNSRDKLILATGTVSAIMYCLSMLFLVNHWPGAHNIWMATLSITAFVFLPSYFFTGIRKEETRVNTMVSSVLIVAVIGIQFTLTTIGKPSSDKLDAYLQNELLLQKLQQPNPAKETTENSMLAKRIQSTCQQLKDLIIQTETGQTYIFDVVNDKQKRNLDNGLGDSFYKDDGKGFQLLTTLKNEITSYNNAVASPQNKIPVTHSVVGADLNKLQQYNNLAVLNNLTQIQLYLVGEQHDGMLSMN